MEPSLPPPSLATWNPASSVWEATESHLCGHSVVFSETWPKSGMTLRGRVYALPTWGPPTDGGESSSSRGEPMMLPTPTATYSGNSPALHLSKKPGRTKVTDLRILVEEVGL